MTRTHGNAAPGIQRALTSVRDTDLRRALRAMTDPSNYDAESLTFRGSLGLLAVREEWVREVVENVLREKGLI